MLLRLKKLASTLVGRRNELEHFSPGETSRAVRWYSYAIIGIAALLFAVMTAPPAWLPTMPAEPAMWFLVALGLSVYLAEATAQGREQGIWVSFSPLFMAAAVAAYGPQPGILAACALAAFLRYLSILQMTGGVLGALFNVSMRSIELVCAGIAFMYLANWVPEWIAIAGFVVVQALVNTAIMLIDGMLHGETAPDRIRALLLDHGPTMAHDIPFIGLGYYALQASPLALFGLFGPLILTHVSRGAEERLVLTERQLGVDGMTGLANRVRFWSSLDHQVAQSDVTSTSLTAIMLDIDNFKILNDTYGHLEGDQALCATADAIARTVRKDDLAARYGGEEFGILVQDTSPQSAFELADRVRIACAAALEKWGTTVSIGIAHRVPGSDVEGKLLVDKADRALYAAKHGGKNRVEVDPGSAHDPTQQAA